MISRPQDCARQHRASWAVLVRKANYSTFNGRRRTYSLTWCGDCGRYWRTKAALPDVPRKD